MSIKLKPFLKWAGGKRSLLPELMKHFPPEISGNYFEPFLGGGAVGIAAPYPRKVLSDKNEELINTFLVVRDHPEELISELGKIQHSKETYYKIRNWDQRLDFKDFDPVLKAARFIYLNKTGFNGLYRVNRAGKFNVPYGGNRLFKVEQDLLRNLSLEFQSNSKNKYKFSVSDFDKAVSKATAGDFVYLDPPYIPLSSTASFVDYAADGFDIDQQQRLSSMIEKLTNKGVRVILSNSDTKLTREIYGHLGKITEVTVPRQVSARATGRFRAGEVIIDNLGGLF